MKKILLVFVATFLIAGCNISPKDLQVSGVISEKSSLQDFQGKPSVIVFGGTYCPHCVASVPEFKKQIWDNYKDKANLWVNVIDKKKFDVAEIAQGFNENLDFEKVSGNPCNYVPSWVVLDTYFNPVLSSCGPEKSLEDMKDALDKVLGVEK